VIDKEIHSFVPLKSYLSVTTLCSTGAHNYRGSVLSLLFNDCQFLRSCSISDI